MSRSRVQSAFSAIAPWLLLAILGVVSIGPLVTPMAPNRPSPHAISTDRAREHIAHIAQEPRPMGSAANAEARSYITEQLTAVGLHPELQTITAPDYFGPPGSTVEVVNVMARIPGTVGSKAVVLMGHYDSVPTTPGANDNAAAVAVILEIGRVLLNGPAPTNDIILLFTDGEEPAPRFGSAAFVADHRWADDVGFVVNLEAAGGSGPSIVIETNGSSSWIIGGLVEGASDPVAFSFLTETASAIGGIGTDFDSFAAAGIPGVHFAYLRGSPIYHTPDDSFSSVDADSVGHHGSNALGVVRFFGNSDLVEPQPTGDDTFFTFLRSQVARYPVGWSLPLVVVAIAVFGVTVAVGVHRENLRVTGIVGSTAAVFGGVVLSVFAVSMVWWFVTGLRTSQVVSESYGYLAAMTLLIVGIWVAVDRYARRRWSAADVLSGTVVVWLVLAVVTGTVLAGMSYVFVWSALGASAYLLICAVFPVRAPWLGIVGVVLVATPTLILTVPPIDTFYQMALPRPGNPDSQMIGVIGVVALFAFLGIALIASTMTASDTRASAEAP